MPTGSGDVDDGTHDARDVLDGYPVPHPTAPPSNSRWPGADDESPIGGDDAPAHGGVGGTFGIGTLPVPSPTNSRWPGADDESAFGGDDTHSHGVGAVHGSYPVPHPTSPPSHTHQWPGADDETSFGHTDDDATHSSGSGTTVVDDADDGSSTETRIVDATAPTDDDPQAPNIVLILVDDMGWNDIGYNRVDGLTNQVETPIIDDLANSGIILERFYTEPDCTPSRASLLTGMYAIHTGMYHDSIKQDSSWGLPTEWTLLPRHLGQLANYSTHMIGKWDIGHAAWELTPTERGFDTFHGYYGASETFFTHQMMHYTTVGTDQDYLSECPDNKFVDLKAGTENWHAQFQYSTDLFTAKAAALIGEHADTPNAPFFLYMAHQAAHYPYEASQNSIDRFSAKFLDGFDTRMKFAACVWELDQSVGQVVDALKGAGAYDNTVIFVASDNGAIPGKSGAGSNWPLRGGKFTLFEGGVRVPAFLHSPLLPAERIGARHSGLFHLTDIVPTFLDLAGAKMDPSKARQLDGISQVQALWYGAPAPRHAVLLQADSYGYRKDPLGFSFGGLVQDDWKLLVNVTHAGSCSPDSHQFKVSRKCYDEPSELAHLAYAEASVAHIGTGGTTMSYAKYFNGTYLFNLADDPTETVDLKEQYPEVYAEMLQTLASELSSMSETAYACGECCRGGSCADLYSVFADNDCYVTPWAEDKPSAASNIEGVYNGAGKAGASADAGTSAGPASVQAGGGSASTKPVGNGVN